jgi:O-Antigen ligase
VSSLPATADAPTRGPGAAAAPAVAFGLTLLVGALVFGAIAGELGAAGQSPYVFGLSAVLLPVLLWKRPQLAPVVILAGAVLVDFTQSTSAETTGPAAVAKIPITSHIPLFTGIGSFHIEPVDLLLLMVAIIYLLKTGPGTRFWPRTSVSRSLGALLGCVVIWIAIGIVHHGTLRVALMEARPYVYLVSAYVLTSVLVRSRQALRAVLWAFVITCAVKGVQTLYIYMQVRNEHPRPDSFIGHEPAYFFAVYILLVGALWLFGVPGRLRKTATWLLPLIIASDTLNNRRAAWAVLGSGLIVLLIIAYRSVPPERRQPIGRLALALVAAFAVYLPVFWNKSDSLASPATAIHSQFSPNYRDSLSDTYREQESANLVLNIHQGGLLGKGFGVPIDYALPITNLLGLDPNLEWVPHNGVLYVLMRMGLVGAIVFWALLGNGIVTGCRLARSVDREMAVVGALVAASLVGWAFEGALDQGFFFYRIALVTGTLLGLAEAARRLQRQARPVAPDMRSPALPPTAQARFRRPSADHASTDLETAAS